MKKFVLLAAVAAGVALAAYKYNQSKREESLWAEATADTWLPVQEEAPADESAPEETASESETQPS